jgi:hypothetical protein
LEYSINFYITSHFQGFRAIVIFFSTCIFRILQREMSVLIQRQLLASIIAITDSSLDASSLLFSVDSPKSSYFSEAFFQVGAAQWQ